MKLSAPPAQTVQLQFYAIQGCNPGMQLSLDQVLVSPLPAPFEWSSLTAAYMKLKAILGLQMNKAAHANTSPLPFCSQQEQS